MGNGNPFHPKWALHIYSSSRGICKILFRALDINTQCLQRSYLLNRYGTIGYASGERAMLCSNRFWFERFAYTDRFNCSDSDILLKSITFLGFCAERTASLLRIFLFWVLVFGALPVSSFEFSFSYLYVRLDKNKNSRYHTYLCYIRFRVSWGWCYGFGSFSRLLHFVYVLS